MTSSFTSGKGDLEKPSNGSFVDTWDTVVNANMNAIDACFSGELGVAFTSANVALTQAQMRNALIVTNGTLSNNVVLLFYPAVAGVFTIINQCVGAFTLSAGVGSTVPIGGTVACSTTGAITIVTDGASVFYIDDGMVQRVVSQQFVPPGMVADFAMPTPPTGWLVCDGSAVSRATYAALFANIGTTWGVGDGSTTFNLPPLRGQFRRGWDNGAGVDPGRAFASGQSDEFKQHNHGITEPNGGLGHKHDIKEAIGANATGGLNQIPNGAGTPVASTEFSTTGIAINNAGTASETRPKNYALLTCIKT